MNTSFRTVANMIAACKSAADAARDDISKSEERLPWVVPRSPSLWAIDAEGDRINGSAWTEWDRTRRSVDQLLSACPGAVTIVVDGGFNAARNPEALAAHDYEIFNWQATVWDKTDPTPSQVAALEKTLARRTAFPTFGAIFSAHRDYRPSCDISDPDMLQIADHYDRLADMHGDPRRAYRYGIRTSVTLTRPDPVDHQDSSMTTQSNTSTPRREPTDQSSYRYSVIDIHLGTVSETSDLRLAEVARGDAPNFRMILDHHENRVVASGDAFLQSAGKTVRSEPVTDHHAPHLLRAAVGIIRALSDDIAFLSKDSAPSQTIRENMKAGQVLIADIQRYEHGESIVDSASTERSLDRDGLPECLTDLSSNQKWFANDQLSNNEDATDEELVEHFIREGEFTREQAHAVIAFRQQALTDFTFELFEGVHEPRPGP